MKKVVGLGACVLDTLIEVPTYPVEDHKYRATAVKKTGGGPVANALVVASKMGLKAQVLGALSNDIDGDFIVEDFNKYGVDTSGATRKDNTTAFTSYVILSKTSGSRTCVFERGSVQDDPTDIDFSFIDDATILHLDGNYIKSAIACAKYAKEKGVLVSLDAGGLYEGIEELLPYVDILIPSEEFALGLTKEESTKKAIKVLEQKYNPKILAVTQGVKGGLYIENGEIKNYPSYKVNCVDSNGAGDTFHGAFISAFIMGYDLFTCLKIASGTSAIKCTKVGMRDALPTLEEVLEFIK